MKNKETPIVFQNQRKKQLIGILHWPENITKPCLVIASHGLGGTKSERRLVRLGRALAKQGIAFFRFDLEGCGDSEGELEDSTIKNQVNDLNSAYEAALKQANINTEKMGFFGHSLGGVTITLFVQKFNIKAKAMVMWSPAFCQKKLIPIWHNAEELKKWKETGYRIRKDKKYGIDYLKENQNKDYSPILADIKAPIFIAHGQEDKAIPIEFSEELAQKYSNIELFKIKGAGHKLDDYNLQTTLIAQTTNWLKTNLL